MAIASSAPKASLRLAAAMLALFAAPALAQAPSEADSAAMVALMRANPAEQYCANIADAAADARFAWQAETLAELESGIEARLAELEAKRAEYEDWLRRREEFQARAEEGVVAIYAKMRPDAAALQLASMGEPMAAAVLVKLNARTASAILNEMEPARAARLTTTMAGAADKPPDTPQDEES